MTAPATPAPAPADPAHPTTPAPAHPAPQSPKEDSNPMRYFWNVFAVIALLVGGYLAYRWINNQPANASTNQPVVTPFGSAPAQPANQPGIDPATGLPLNQNINDIDITITGWADLNSLCNSGVASCEEDQAGRVFVVARSNNECKRVCKTNNRNVAKPNCVSAKNTTAKRPSAPVAYRHRDPSGNPGTTVVQAPPSNQTTSSSPVASIADSGHSQVTWRDLLQVNTAHAAAPRDTIAMGGSATISGNSPVSYVDNRPVTVNDNRPSAAAVAEASNNQQTTVIEGHTYVDGDQVTVYNDNRVYNTYNTYVIPQTPGPVYIIINGHLSPTSDICQPGGVCETCKLRGDCPPWLTDKCDKECASGPPPATPVTPGPSTPVVPTVVPTRPSTGKCYNKGWRIGDEPDDSPFVVVAEESGRIWQPCLNPEWNRPAKEHSITVPGDAKFGQGHWFFGEGTQLVDSAGNVVVDYDFETCVALVPAGNYKIKQKAGRMNGIDLWLRPECNGGTPLPTQTPKPVAPPSPGNPLPPCGSDNILSSTRGTLEVSEGCNGWIGQSLLGDLSGDARKAMFPDGWTISFTTLRGANYDFNGVSSCISSTPITFGKNAAGEGICIGTIMADFSNNTDITLEAGKTYYLGTPPDRVKNGGVEMFMK